jgi:hypothetical protein
MIGVVILHYNNSDLGGGFQYVPDRTVNWYYLYFTENIFICAVNLFIMISAYFLSCTQRRKFIKVVELIIQVMTFRCVFYIAGIVRGNNTFLIKSFIGSILPVNYFVILYSVVYLVSPYINLLLDNLSEKDVKKLIIMLLLIFSVWSIWVDLLENIGASVDGLSTVGMSGSQHGYSVVNFILVYFCGAYIRKNNIKLSSKKAILGIFFVFILLYIFSIAEHFAGFNMTTSWNYNNPLIILMASLILLLFMNIQFQNRFVNELAKGAFTCYLFHGAFMKYLFVENIVNQNIIILVLHQFGVAIALYLISYVVYKIYYLCSNWFIKLITPICNKVNVSL